MVNKEIDNNDATMEMADAVYKANLNALSDVIADHGYQNRRYSLLKYQPESLCLMCNEGRWEVFFSERNNKEDERSFSDINDACRYMISKIALSFKEVKKMQKEYDKKVLRAAQTPASLMEIDAILRRFANRVAAL